MANPCDFGMCDKTACSDTNCTEPTDYISITTKTLDSLIREVEKNNKDLSELESKVRSLTMENLVLRARLLNEPSADPL